MALLLSDKPIEEHDETEDADVILDEWAKRKSNRILKAPIETNEDYKEPGKIYGE